MMRARCTSTVRGEMPPRCRPPCWRSRMRSAPALRARARSAARGREIRVPGDCPRDGPGARHRWRRRSRAATAAGSNGFSMKSCAPLWMASTAVEMSLRSEMTRIGAGYGHVDSDGYLFLAGRSDDVINRGGEKIYPREIEDFLLAQPGVRSAAVVGAHNEVLGERPVAYVVPAGPARPGQLPDELRAACEAALPAAPAASRLPPGPGAAGRRHRQGGPGPPARAGLGSAGGLHPGVSGVCRRAAAPARRLRRRGRRPRPRTGLARRP